MNKITKTSLAVMAASLTSLTNEAAVSPQPLPAGVVQVFPAQGYIDTSDNQYPLGAGSISVEFEAMPQTNPECTELISIYVDGADVPAETLVAGQSAFTDAMGFPLGGFNFRHAYADPGTYKIVIPKGTWTVSGSDSPAMTLSYEIRKFQWLTPEAGIVDEISSLTLTVAGNGVEAASATLKPELLSGIDTYPLTVSFTPNDRNPAFTDIVMTPDHTLTDARDYTLFIPGGCYSFTNTEGEKILTQETVAVYSIPVFPQPECSPADGSELTSFSTFTLLYPEGFVPIVTDDMGFSYIYAVSADGNTSSNYLYRLKETTSDDKGVTIGILGDDGKYHASTEYAPADGEYVLKVAGGLFSGFWGDEFVNNPEYTYHFTINAGKGATDAIPAFDNRVTIVTLDGKVLARDADPAVVKTLPEGIYIVNGKLVYSL